MITVSESLKKGIDSFLEFSPEVSSHMENSENPHSVTKEQVGLENVKNEEQATKAEFLEHKENKGNPHAVTKEQVGLGNLKNLEQATKTEFLEHKENKGNPHAVTKEQIGLGNVKDEEQATQAEFLQEKERLNSHKEDFQNPHKVTKSQIGLSLVENAQQATAAEFFEHVNGTADRHSGRDIMYSDTKSVNEKIDELLVESGSGTMYHSELSERDNPNQHSISAITGLRGELDALAENFDGISHDTLSGRDGEDAHPISAISGLSEKVDTILIYEGITTDGSITELKTKSSGKFVSESKRLYYPEGYIASLEIEVLAAREQGGIITDSNACLFKSQGVMYQLNSGGRLCVDEFKRFAYDNTSPYSVNFVHAASDEGNTYKNMRVSRLAVTGAEDHRVFWRAVIRLKNILKVEA